MLLSPRGELVLSPGASDVPATASVKFDVRQLVLVTSWRPLCIHIFDSFYLRLATAVYDTSPAGISQRFAHVCNYSVQKHAGRDAWCDETEESTGLDATDTLTSEDLRRKLQSARGAEIGDQLFRHQVLEPMRAAIVLTLRAAEPHVHHRRNSFELYGMDFVIDQQLRPWLLEVNLSPALNKRTPYMASMLSAMADGLVGIVLRMYKQPTVRAQRAQRPSHYDTRSVVLAMYELECFLLCASIYE